MKKQEQFSVLNLSRQDVPIVTEDIKTRYQWVPVGILDQDDYFGLVTEAYNTSTTNAACVDGVADLIYGKGLFTNEFIVHLSGSVSGSIYSGTMQVYASQSVDNDDKTVYITQNEEFISNTTDNQYIVI